ncbi:MAG: hypothetical protein ABJ379_12800, partial [Roseibium sp.]
MANPTKAKDPAEAALSAVEEALKLDFGGPEAAASEAAAEANTVAADPANRPQAEPRGPTQREERQSRRRGRGGRPPAANDDRRNIGNLIYALQRRPSSAPFWGALALSAVWAALGSSLFMSAFSDKVASFSDPQALLSSPEMILAAVGIGVPIIFFFVMAMMIWRAQE